MEHTNIHEFQKHNKMPFSPWSAVHQLGMWEFCCKEKKSYLSSYPSLYWKLNFLSFSKHSWKATSFSTSGGVCLSHWSPTSLTCSCQCTFKILLLSLCKLLSTEPFPILAPSASLEAFCIAWKWRSAGGLEEVESILGQHLCLSEHLM